MRAPGASSARNTGGKAGADTATGTATGALAASGMRGGGVRVRRAVEAAGRAGGASLEPTGSKRSSDGTKACSRVDSSDAGAAPAMVGGLFSWARAAGMNPADRNRNRIRIWLWNGKMAGSVDEARRVNLCRARRPSLSVFGRQVGGGPGKRKKTTAAMNNSS